MKKKIIPILVVIIMMINQVMVIAVGVTSYLGKSMTLENGDNVDIVYNEVLIDTETSNISNMYIFQNTSNSDVVIKASIPLENLIIGNKIENLEIKVNNAKVKYEIEKTSEEVLYKFDIKAKANEVKKIDIKYKTQNDLTEATIIRYNMEGMKLGDKKIKKVKVDVKIREKDIPMVTSIYPPHYTFDSDTKIITVEYYNMPINNLTKDIIIEKSTLDSIISNADFEYYNYEDIISGYTYEEYNKEIYKYLKVNLDSLIENGNNGKRIKELSNVNSNYTCKFNDNDNEYEYSYYNTVFDQIDDYLNVKYLIKNKKYKELMRYVKLIGYEQTSILIQNIAKRYVVIDLEYGEKNEIVYGVQSFEIYEGAGNWVDKNIVIDIADTKDEKIYAEIFEGYDEEKDEDIYKYKDDYIVNILKEESFFGRVQSNGANVINLATLANNNVTTQEKIDYINSVGFDLYIKLDLYKGKYIQNGTWYNEKSGEEEPISFYGYLIGYNNNVGKKMLDIFEKECFKEMSQYHNEDQEEYNIEDDFRKIEVTNDSDFNSIKIPALIVYTGQIKNKNGMKIYDALGTNVFKYLKDILNDKEVKQMVDLNKSEIEQTKKDINAEIEKLVLTIIDDEEEIQAKTITINKDNIIYIVISSCLLIGIIACISILIIKNKKGGSKHEK